MGGGYAAPISGKGRNGRYWHDPAHVLVSIFAGRQPKPFGAFLTQRSHSCIAANYPSFDHIVGADEQRGGHDEAKGFSGLEIDHEFSFGALLDGEVSRFGALENFSDIDAGCWFRSARPPP
jgi:hypothetical protein